MSALDPKDVVLLHSWKKVAERHHQCNFCIGNKSDTFRLRLSKLVFLNFLRSLSADVMSLNI